MLRRHALGDLDVFHHRKVGKNHPAFGHVAQSEAHDAMRRPAGHIGAGEQHAAAARTRETDDRAQGRGLAHAVSPEHRGDLSRGHIEVDTLQDMAATVIGMEGFEAQHYPVSPR
jgi:hypothetical protein